VRRARRIGGLVAATLLLVGAAVGTMGRAPAHATGPKARPNVVVVVLDDLEQTDGSFWKALPHTRALLADRGVTFTNAFVTNPLCCPARATILTGMYPHDTGVWAVYQESIGGAENETLGVRMQADGYTTALAGKYLNGYETEPDRVPPGWDEWFGLAGTFLDGYSYTANHNGTIESFGTRPRDYQTDVVAREARSFVGQTERDDTKPFFLYLAPTAGHWSMGPAPRHAQNPYADDRLPRPPNFDERDVSDKPFWLREGVPRINGDVLRNETERYRRNRGTLYAADDMVEALVDELRGKGELDHTYFVFTSDNGYNRGAHRLRGKAVPYEESIRIPLVISGPGIRHGTEDRLVIHPDLAPTIYDLAGVPVPDDVDGRSLVPLLHGDDGPWRRDFLVEFRGQYGTRILIDTRADVEKKVASENGLGAFVPSYRAVRTARWKYVEWYGGTDHDYELYDLRADPYELENLLATPEGATEHASTTARLQSRLEALAACAGATCH